ncbi:MAG: hypothetical protein R6U02_00710 [Alkalibacterium sp.]|uniref:hypothetical protein n=1 Tax=Alkalibacterium sp. TaxID=1872447 RepID=UPI0039706A9F
MEMYFKKIKKAAIFFLIVSLISIVIGYILWMIPIPIQDFHLMTSEEILISQKDLAFNYSLGRFLLYSGFIGLGISSVYFLSLTILRLINKYKK